MKRRKFLSSLITSGLIMNPVNNIVRPKFNNPKLVFDVDSDPATVEHKKGNKFIYKPDKNINSSRILITCNRYGEPNNVYFKKKTKNKKQKIRMSIPDTKHRFCYTIYSDNGSNLNYIGESLPMINKSDIETDLDYLESPESNINYSKSVNRGYYNIKCDLSDRSYNFPVSQQYYTMNKRIVQYGNSQSYIRDNIFLENIGKSILDQLNVDDEYEKFYILKDFAQNMNWVRDLESKNKLEYIRDPRRTVTNFIGDCKDTTILLNGLLENVLDIYTVMFFAPTHIYSGIKIKTLPEEIHNNIKDHHSIYDLNGEKFVPLESTGTYDIGEEPVRSNMYMYYDKSYNIQNLSGLSKHLRKLPTHIIKEL